MTDLKAWLKEIVNETEHIDKQSHDNYIEHFKQEELHSLRKTIFREKPENEEALKEYSENMKISLTQFYEKWKKNKREQESLVEASKPYVIPVGFCLITKIAVVLYELKQENPEQFNWFYKTFL
jgi:accessory colonization factor AcfC